ARCIAERIVFLSKREEQIVYRFTAIIKQQKTLMDSKKKCINSHFGMLSLVLSAYISNTFI
ncbi:hypothetical protein, partial [Prevotella histicola]|uniref:hypothetical protein n=1 Tax=Prevotella histicola TaxID=470565 RepID=UPI00241E5B8A